MAQVDALDPPVKNLAVPGQGTQAKANTKLPIKMGTTQLKPNTRKPKLQAGPLCDKWRRGVTGGAAA